MTEDNETREETTEIKKEEKKMSFDFNKILPFVGIALVAFVLGYFASGMTGMTGMVIADSSSVLSAEDATEKAITFANENLLTPTVVASPAGVEERNEMYIINMSIDDGNEVTFVETYVSKDGNLLFVRPPIDMATYAQVPASGGSSGIGCDDVEKTDGPVLQAFVVSYCPFGVQMQRILNEVRKVIGYENIEVRYIGAVQNGRVTAMHGEQEAQENLRQICLREEQDDKFWPYLDCFMKSGNVEACLDEAGVNAGVLTECMAGSGVDYAAEDFALASQFRVGGSPTLILNGKQISEFDFASGEFGSSEMARSAENLKQLICCSFNEMPSECSQELSRAQASTGFSATYSASGSGSGAGSC